MTQTLPIIQGYIIDVTHGQALKINWASGEAQVLNITNPETHEERTARDAIYGYCVSVVEWIGHRKI